MEIISGRHSVYHAMAAGRRRVGRIFLLEGWKERDQAGLLDLARSKKIPFRFLSPASFQSQFGRVPHQGLLAETDGYPYADPMELAGRETILILDGIQDPQNLGALCRTAYLFGVDGVVIPSDRSASIGEGACQASAGAVEYLKICRVTNIVSYIKELKKEGFWIYGADQEGEKGLHEEVFPGCVALVIGNEERGLRHLVKERCDIIVKVPTEVGAIDSLNASVAGGICLYEIQRRKIKQTVTMGSQKK